MNFSQLLDEKIDTIIQNWMEAVRLDRQISSTDNLVHSAIQNHLPDVLKAMTTVLSQFQDSDIQSIVQNSLEHGILRAEQGFTPQEIAREYRLLRQIIFSTLEADLVNGTVREVMRVHRAIDETIDEAIGQCFKSYVEERLQELQQLQSQAELTNQELTRLLKANQENLSQLAHELKNPLNSIIGYSELILRSSQKNIGTDSAFRNLEHIERVVRNGRQLLHLINDALEISRYQAGKMKLHTVPTDVCSSIQDVVKMLEPLASAKELEVVIDCNLSDRMAAPPYPAYRPTSDAPKTVVIDPLRLQQIVTNLFSNSIRYTESGSIKLRCGMLSDNQWYLSVSDTGIGITPEDQVRIFDPFFRSENSVTHSVDGTGLGLAIVWQLVKLMQGKIELVSQVGVGSTFTVILPVNSNLKIEE